MSSVEGRTAAVSISDGGALVAAPSHQSRHWRPLVALVGAAVACSATLALLTLSAALSSHAHPLASNARPQSHRGASLPVSLAAVASASIGAGERSFWPVRHGAALTARGGGIDSTFTTTGAHLRVAQGTLGLSLAALGRGARAARIAAVAPEGAGSQVLYRHQLVTEFYRNGPYGLEQGFVLRQRPSAGTGSLVLRLTLGGSLIPTQAGSQALFRTPRGATALRYGQLSALDATGRRLPARVQIRNRALELRIDDSNARYPLRIDPFIQQGEKLVAKSPAEEIGKGEFGASVALSSAGNTALIGAPDDNKNVGAAWVFTREGSTWSQRAKLVATSGEPGEGEFGTSVALDSKGETALIGGPGDQRIVEAEGEVTEKSPFVKGLPSTTGIFAGSKVSGAKITPGTSVTKVISETEVELSTAVEGTGSATVKEKLTFMGFNVGAAWVFTGSGATWTQQAKLVAKSGEEIGEGRFGTTVALSGEGGNTALIGGPFDNESKGAAWAFTRSGSTWTQQAKLVGGEEIGNSEFGASVALDSEKGNTALIGGPVDNTSVGAAWVFTRSSEKWNTGVKLAKTEEIGEGEFGTSVALSAEKASVPTALVGGRCDGEGEPNFECIGAAWVFIKGSKWEQQKKLVAKSGEEIGAGLFGEGVALSSTGNTALISGPGDAGNVGAAWVFTRSGSTWTQHGEKLRGSGEIGAGTFGDSVALDKEGVTALIGGPFDNESVGAAWAFASQEAPPTVVTELASEVTATSAKLNAKVNPNGLEVTQANCKFEYGETTAYGKTASCESAPGKGEFAVEVHAKVTSLTAKVYHFRISATNAKGTSKGGDRVLTATPPTVVTKAASEFTQTSATLNATVNPNGGEVSECVFEYGETEAYGSTVSCKSLPAPGEVNPVPVSASATNLKVNTTYDFRISATTTGGTSKGSNLVFKTLPKAPTVLTRAASAITLSSATLNATVNPNGGEVSECKFEYGTSISYESSAPCTPSPPLLGTSAVPVSASVAGLAAHTVYHFRVSATSASGTSKGSDRTFTTANPHYYADGALVGAEPTTSIDWGTITLNAAKGGIAGSFVTCHIAGASTLFNPEGGGAGEGLTQVFASFDCESEKVCFGGQVALVAEGLPWHAILTEEVPGTIRQEITGVKVMIKCLSGETVTLEEPYVIGAGEKGPRPSSNQGTSALHPSFLEFDEHSGELELEGSAGTRTRRAEGAVKIFGYNAQELITIKSP